MRNSIASNDLRFLAEKLADSIHCPGDDLFSKTIIITQSPGMNAWLQTEIAKKNGIFTNFAFLNQDGLFNEVHRIIFGEKLLNNTDNIKHRIYELLNDPQFLGSFPKIATYYENNEERRIQLAGKLADLFDQYQLYRPEMLVAWEKGKSITEDKEANKLRLDIERWQQWLWKRLGLQSKQDIKDRILKSLATHDEKLKKEIPAIHVFGISIFTEFHHNFIQALSDFVDVKIYINLPTSEQSYKNDLLKSLGSKARELAEMNKGYDFIPRPSKGETFLGRLQDQILNNVNAEVPGPDDSIQINSCYTPAREAECLYNYLLDQFSDTSAELKPEDVLVIAGDIDSYTPYIKAVFRNAPISIPFQVTGTVSSSEDSMVSALELILNFSDDDLTAEKVMGLLEHNRIKSRFRIESTEYLRDIIRKANIRFGRENSKDDDTVYVSWDYGLKKLALGYAMLSEEPYALEEDLNVIPYMDSEASQSYDIFRLKAFVDRLEKLIDDRLKSRTMADWNDWLQNDVFDSLIFVDKFEKDDNDERNGIYKALSYIEKLEQDTLVPYEVFLDALKTKLFMDPGSFKMNTGRVTISSPVPVRGLPFRIICFIGLNNDIFPRRDSRLGFDLIKEDDLEKETRRGDRNKTETDKLLFLETLLAAKDKLYISYIGQSIKDNNKIPMSTVTDSLYDYLGSEKVLNKHPLHGFSSKYCEDEENIFTYLYNESPEEFEPTDRNEPELQEVSANDLVKFFQHPIEWYFENNLGIKYSDESDSLPETEHFELNKLEEWVVKNDLTGWPPDKDDEYLAEAIMEGKLPLKTLGELKKNRIAEDISELRSAFQTSSQGLDAETESVSIKARNLRITGKIGNIYAGKYVAYAFSDNLKYQVKAFLESLLLYKAGKINSAELLYLKKNWNVIKLHRISYPGLNETEIDEKIDSLLGFFKKGRRSPLLFSPKAAKNIITEECTENIFYDEAHGNKYTSLPENKYVRSLWQQEYFNHFTLEDYDKDNFNTGIYNEKTEFEEIIKICQLLNLKND